jgi:hypothetical protein
LIWLIFFATKATITITANTSEIKIDQPVSLMTDGQTDVSKHQLRLASAEPVKKTNQIEFTATGKKDVGDKATGSVTVDNHLTPFNAMTGASNTITLAAGTILSTGSQQYTTNTTISVAGYSSGTVNVTAVAIGPGHNIGAGIVTTVSGYAQSAISATVDSGGITGGTQETITVVQQSDLDKITDQIKNDTGSAAVRSELASKFGSDAMAIEDSFSVEFGNIQSKPAVGEKADKATASLEITYTMSGVSKSDVSAILMRVATSKLSNKDNQMVFDNGYNAVQLLSYNQGGNGNPATMRLVTTAKVGPNINEDKLREDAVGKKANEISSAIKRIDGVEDVQVDFFPFWVNVAPEPNRIYIVKNGL